MDIPKIMANFGQGSGEDLLFALIKQSPLMAKDKKKELLNLFMDLNLDTEKITFDFSPYDAGHRGSCEKKYHYFGNNPAAAKQVYVVRDVGSFFHYWFGRPHGILQNVLDFLAEGELQELLKECVEIGFFNEDGLAGNRIVYRNNVLENLFSIDKEKKEIYLNQEKCTVHKFFEQCLELGTNTKIMLIIPRIIKSGQKIILSTHPDYIAAIAASLQGKQAGEKRICHVCGQQQEDINTKEYTAKLSKSSVGKVFVTTTINYAPLFNKSDHEKNYSLCKSCYEQILFGEKKIMSEFKLKIAQEDCLLLFEELIEPLDLTGLEKVKQEVDFVFNPKKTEEWLAACQYDFTDDQEIDFYQFNMVFYKTDGKSCAVKKTIESISSIRLQYVIKLFEKIRATFAERLLYFTLGHVYRLVPVSSNKKGEQVNIQRVLDLYGAILKGERVDAHFIFDLACEALEKGLGELRSAQIRNYKNLYGLQDTFGSKELGRDRFIRNILLRYIALFHVLEKLEILDKEVFITMTELEGDLPEGIQECEVFLQTQGFRQRAKGLFYLGVLLYQIGSAQWKQGHKTKPILDKVTYAGMTSTDVLTLYLDALEKMRQYKNHIHLWYCEQITKQLHLYLGDLQNMSLFNEKENVFYIMSGYAFSVRAYQKKKTDEKENENGQEQ